MCVLIAVILLLDYLLVYKEGVIMLKRNIWKIIYVFSIIIVFTVMSISLIKHFSYNSSLVDAPKEGVYFGEYVNSNKEKVESRIRLTAISKELYNQKEKTNVFNIGNEKHYSIQGYIIVGGVKEQLIFEELKKEPFQDTYIDENNNSISINTYGTDNYIYLEYNSNSIFINWKGI